MTLVQPEKTTEKPATNVNLQALLDECTAVHAQRHAEIREAERQDSIDAVEYATAAAAKTFGEKAAAALGRWLPAEMMDEGCLQASVVIAPGAYLTHTTGENGSWFTLLTSCTRCSTSSETRIYNLLTLAEALHKSGVR
ncbi:hypothetical protein [Streptomyces sp. MMBL 11-1]|uniref:hypothetical protein n=1 Tax=Streptomyces sp. MMBL 11-1 TaxID=3026420 RepID=UPI0023628906|nr:hypothetical protein [Streptomyces sp. MMBL 11-1]